MKFCQPHWTALREMVIAKGMGELISKDGAAAAERMVEELEGTATNATYDPLMAAYWSIMGMALEKGGLYLMYSKPGDGADAESHYCPLCEVEEQGMKQESKSGAAVCWMEGCTDSILMFCREQGLLARPQ